MTRTFGVTGHMGESGMVVLRREQEPTMFWTIAPNQDWEHGWREQVRFAIETALNPAGHEMDIRLPDARPTQTFEVEVSLV